MQLTLNYFGVIIYLLRHISRFQDGFNVLISFREFAPRRGEYIQYYVYEVAYPRAHLPSARVIKQITMPGPWSRQGKDVRKRTGAISTKEQNTTTASL